MEWSRPDRGFLLPCSITPLPHPLWKACGSVGLPHFSTTLLTIGLVHAEDQNLSKALIKRHLHWHLTLPLTTSRPPPNLYTLWDLHIRTYMYCYGLVAVSPGEWK